MRVKSRSSLRSEVSAFRDEGKRKIVAAIGGQAARAIKANAGIVGPLD